MSEEGVRWDASKGCPYLELAGIQWRCGIFLRADAAKREAMTQDMGIGMGCSSTLFNTDREEMIRRLQSRSRSSSPSPGTSSDSSAATTR